MECEYKFEGSVPDYYDRLFGAQLFEPYARDLVSHLSDTSKISRVLELGCGTGRCTRQIITQIEGPLDLTVTDISEDMLNFAKKFVSACQEAKKATISWQIVDECELPYEENSFDLVICQFGYMFGSDKQKAFSESVRVLRPGGVLLFNVWDDIKKNPLCDIANNVIETSHPDDHDDFFSLPFSMHEREAVAMMLQTAGLVDLTVADEQIECKWRTPFEAADAIIDGSPISLILKARGEDIQPTLDKISAAYAVHRAESGRDGEDDSICFTMNAVVFLGYKPAGE